MNTAIHVSSVDPHTLSGDDILSLAEVTQDMWADGIGEFIQCTECDHMHSKKDIYGHLKSEHYQHTVRHIMGDFQVDNIRCQECSGSTKPVFGRANIEVVRDRLMNTRKAFLAVARNEHDEIVGFEDAYVGTLDSIFSREFESHYRDIGISEIRMRISRALGHDPDELLVLSDIGLLDRYRSFANMFAILNRFSQTMSHEYDAVPGFTELDERNILSKVSTAIGGISLGIRQDPTIASRITNIGDGYMSDLIVCDSIVPLYRKSFGGSPVSLLKLLRKSRNQIGI